MLARINGNEIYYAVIGEGRPILMMHGGPGLDHTYLRPWLDPLAEHFQVIYYDHSGNGRSPRPDGYDEVTHASWIADADALRAHLGHERIILLGQSYGGFLAQEYALQYGNRLDGLILVCTAPALDYMDVVVTNAQQRGTPEQFRAVSEDLARPMVDNDDFRKLWLTILPLYFKRFDPAVAATTDAATHYNYRAHNHAFSACVPQFNVADRLAEITTPTLMISGREDWITPPAQGERIHAGLPNSELKIFDESGHMPFIEEQQAFLSTVRDWIERLPKGANA